MWGGGVLGDGADKNVFGPGREALKVRERERERALNRSMIFCDVREKDG